MSPKAGQENPHSGNRQRGIALLIVLALLVLLVGTVMVGFSGDLSRQSRKQQQTTDALALAKEALIGYAAGVDLTVGAYRPGDLPCPDTDNDGVAEASCGNAAGTTGQALRLGRLPWKTLGLDDLRDGDGERLWYGVSNNFKNNTRTTCGSPGDAGCLNSDTKGTITVRDSNGVIVVDGTNPDPFTPSGTIAVIVSAGAVIQRQGSATTQDRSAVGVNNPINYLDVGNGEDNAVFTDGTTDGFINGPVYDASRNLIVNDRVLAITYSDLMPILQRRVAKEVFNCLTGYAADPQNNGRYPWAADMNASASGDYTAVFNTHAGRIPDTFDYTLLGVGGPVISSLCQASPLLCMRGSWTSSCTITMGTWWTNWKELALYSVADAYKPQFLGAAPSCGSCLTVNTPSSVQTNKKFVAMVAGKRLSTVAGGQPRTTVPDKGTAANYLEGENDWTTGAADTFAQQPATSNFNDYLLFQ
jgi:type II secretory pathway pseudopilin PulG